MIDRRAQRREFRAQRAAYLLAERGFTQREIGASFGGLSQSRVSRLLKLAEEREWLVRDYRLAASKLPPGRYEELKRGAESSALSEALDAVRAPTGVKVSRLIVVDSGPRGLSEQAITRRLTRFGQEIAGALDDLLRAATSVALTWGRTLSLSLDEVEPDRSAGRSVRIVPVCPEPIQESDSRYTSTRLARRLHDLLESKAPAPPSLTGIPALIPGYLGPRTRLGVRDLLGVSESYREVFDGPGALIRRVDLLLTSVGSRQRTLGFMHQELLKAAGKKDKPMSEAELRRLVVGDIGGVLLPQPGQSTAVDKLNTMWTGVNRDHLAHIAKAAARESSPGVVVLSIHGEGRPEALAAAIRSGLVNGLVIDRWLADGLTELLNRKK